MAALFIDGDVICDAFSHDQCERLAEALDVTSFEYLHDIDSLCQ
jgi:hypothetical protein